MTATYTCDIWCCLPLLCLPKHYVEKACSMCIILKSMPIGPNWPSNFKNIYVLGRVKIALQFEVTIDIAFSLSSFGVKSIVIINKHDASLAWRHKHQNLIMISINQTTGALEECNRSNMKPCKQTLELTWNLTFES